MTPRKARLGVLAVFLTGALTGAAALHLVRLRAEARILRSRDVLAELLVRQLDRELSLTGGQEAQVADAIRSTRAQLLSQRERIVPFLVAAFESGQTRIREILTPEQRVRFDALVDDRRRLFRDIVRTEATGPATPPVLPSPENAGGKR